MNIAEVIVFVIYLCFMLGVGIYFFLKTRAGGEKDYFLGGRKMGPWVTALSAGASDMSAWVLMGLPTSIYALGLGQVWISVGLAIGYAISWTIEAPRLRKFSIAANDSITVPQYLSNRFLSKSYVLQIICAVVFLVAYTIYAASSMKACGTLFNTVLGIDPMIAMYLSALIIVGYTFLGGFSAVCWTDFFQGMLILGALLLAPIFAVFMLKPDAMTEIAADTPGFWNPFTNPADIISGLAWGLGYFGMPHIIIRYMALKSQHEMKKSAKIGITWNVLIVVFAAIVGITGRMFLGMSDDVSANSTVFINMVRIIFPGIISGILLSSVLAASMSTADSQLLSAASAFASDVYKPLIRKNKAADKEMLWVGRLVVLAVAIAALVIASLPNSGTIMSLVSNAWGIFGAAIGPGILLSLFWKRFNFPGVVASIVAGAVVDICWLTFLSSTGIYELLPGFVAGLLAGIIVSLCTKEPSEDVKALYDKALKYED
ncbi:MAG: sodium/proline symporter [Clostridiales bacterium]|nr:sodium/proline symporter [Clostridiales bacterium]